MIVEVYVETWQFLALVDKVDKVNKVGKVGKVNKVDMVDMVDRVDRGNRGAHFPQTGLNLKSCVLPISLQEPLKHLSIDYSG